MNAAGALLPGLATAAGLLVVSGAAKLREPAAAREAARRLGAPGAPALVAALGAAELALGAAALIHPAPAVAGAVAALYLCFAAAAERLRRLPEPGSCGCLGGASTPPARVHTLLCLLLALAAALAALRPSGGLAALAAAEPLAAAPALAGVAAATALAAAALVHLPQLLTAYRRTP